MRSTIPTLLGLLLIAPCAASAEATQVQLAYNAYAAGIEIMQMHALFGIGRWNYHVDLDYHTTGLAGFFYRGRQVSTVRGLWQNHRAEPLEFFGDGVWHGKQRRTLIDYVHGMPQIKELQPPQNSEREPVPADLQRNTIDTLSALVQLMRHVEDGHSCDTEAHTYDGRRVLDISAHTGREEELKPTDRSSFSGTALRCDFDGRELAGFLHGEDDPEHRKPLHGSAWLAQLVSGAPPLPVRITFQTRWFGWATMYLTGANAGNTAQE